jgi:hypothetical protein
MSLTRLHFIRSRPWRAIYLTCALAVISYIFTDVLDLDGSNLLRLMQITAHAGSLAEAAQPIEYFIKPGANQLKLKRPRIEEASHDSGWTHHATWFRSAETEAHRLHNRRAETLTDFSSATSPDH